MPLKLIFFIRINFQLETLYDDRFQITGLIQLLLTVIVKFKSFYDVTEMRDPGKFHILQTGWLYDSNEILFITVICVV